jgi:hypothetical protein
MQDLTDLNNRSVDQQTEEDWEMVRERHPARAQEIIAASAPGSEQPNPFSIGLENNIKPLHIPLSLICKGHGSKYYEDVAAKLNRRTFNIEGRGKPVRGALLTSLLLLADELDLHGSRAVWKKNYPLSKVSELHYFRHHFVNHVKVVKLNGTEKQIQITLALPEDTLNGNKWAEDLQNWLERKLKFELKRTEEHIQVGFDGYLQWAKQEERVVFFKEPAEPYEKKLPPGEVINLLHREITHVLDWKEAVKKIKARFTSRTGGIFLIRGGEEQGSDQFFIHLSLLLNCQKDRKAPEQSLANMEFKTGNSSATLDQIVFSLYEKLFDEELDVKPAEAMNALVEKARNADMFCIVSLQNYDQAQPREWEELSAMLIDPAIHEHFLFVINSGERLDGAESFELPDEFSGEDMIRYFEKLGYYGVKAQEKTTMLRKMQDIQPKPCANTILKHAVILSGR